MTKTIVSTVLITVSALTVASVLFLNSILGLFNLAVTSAETLEDLKNSKQIVQAMKERHKTKKVRISKKFVKRTSKKIASNAVAAATIGTAAVVATVATLEVYSYCEDKEEIHEDGNILYSHNEEFDYSACAEAAAEDVKVIVASVRESATEGVSSAWEDTKDFTNEHWTATKKASSDAWKRATSSTGKLWHKLLE